MDCPGVVRCAPGDAPDGEDVVEADSQGVCFSSVGRASQFGLGISRLILKRPGLLPREPGGVGIRRVRFFLSITTPDSDTVLTP